MDCCSQPKQPKYQATAPATNNLKRLSYRKDRISEKRMMLNLIGSALVRKDVHRPVSACFATQCAVCFALALIKVSGVYRSSLSCSPGRIATSKTRACRISLQIWLAPTWKNSNNGSWCAKFSFSCNCGTIKIPSKTSFASGRRTRSFNRGCNGSKTLLFKCTSRQLRSRR